MNDENAYYNSNRGFLPAMETSTAATTAFTVSTPGASPANKGALSFILSSSSSSSSCSDSEFQAPVVPAPRPLIKRKRTRAGVPAPTRARANSNTPREAIRFSSSTTGVSPSSSSHTNDTTAMIKKGSKFCVVDGCMSRAKHAKRCWRHGGSVKCKVADCDNRAKSKGVCWSHGGGTLCSFDKCDTISVSNGFCWAHGGGKRCAVHQCSKPAYERTQNYCTAHFEEMAGAPCIAERGDDQSVMRPATRMSQ